VALFTDRDPEPRRVRMGGVVGWAVFGILVIGGLIVATVPAPYVVEQPGPVFNTLGDVTIGDEQVPLIEIPDETTYPTSGSLDMLTVTVSGNRENLPNWLEVGAAWLDPSKAVVPVDEVYPEGVSQEQSNEQGRIDMENSQKEAIAAALTELGHEFPSTVTVIETQPGLPSDGVLEAGDVVLSVNGDTFADVTGLRAEIAENGVEHPASIVLDRAGQERTVQITPVFAEDGQTPVIGVFVGGDYEFPFDVRIQLENVGGPSAGMMFALGIIDKLSPGELNGGQQVAGTGTISGGGEVGAIGGIRQKMWGAVRAGADWFLAPAGNCDEVVGHVPSGLSVFAVATLDDALTALGTIAADGDTTSLPTCTAS
jgi:PDZ domain-containing protein